MSSEFASNETTPLRRQPDNIVTSQSTTRINNVNNTNNNNNNIQIENNSELIGSSGGSNNNNNINNNNHINGLTSTPRNYIVHHNNNQIIHQDQYKKMDKNRQIIWKVTWDFVILLCVGFPILFFYLWGEPYKRGFFCDDESLRHPFHESTVKNYMLYLLGLVLPLCIIIITEYFNARCEPNQSFRFMDWDIPTWMVGAYKQIGVFAFGACSQQLIVDIAKYSIGRLRPHFFDVCQPRMLDGTTCADAINFNRYIEEFTCLGVNSTPRMLKEVRLSFPSGHSSFSSFTMIYCAIYLHSRMTWRGSKLLKHFLQFLLFVLAWFTALSRISDYKHHWSDVLSGATIGVIFAILVSQFVSDLFQPKEQKSYLPQSRQELTQTTPSQTQLNYNNHYQHQNSTTGTNGHGHA